MFVKQQWRAIIWALFILLITGLPGDSLPEIVTFWEWLQPDKIVHIFVFGVLAFILLYDARVQYFQPDKRFKYITAVVSGTVFYGILTEILQHYVFIGRSGNVYDVVADAVGAIAGWVLFKHFVQKKIIGNHKSTAN